MENEKNMNNDEMIVTNEELEVLARFQTDEKFKKKMIKKYRRQQKLDEFKAMPLKDKAKVIAKPVAIGVGVIGAVAVGTAVALDKLGRKDKADEPIELEPWDYGIEEFNSEQNNIEPAEETTVE